MLYYVMLYHIMYALSLLEVLTGRMRLQSMIQNNIGTWTQRQTTTCFAWNRLWIYEEPKCNWGILPHPRCGQCMSWVLTTA